MPCVLSRCARPSAGPRLPAHSLPTRCPVLLPRPLDLLALAHHLATPPLPCPQAQDLRQVTDIEVRHYVNQDWSRVQVGPTQVHSPRSLQNKLQWFPSRREVYTLDVKMGSPERHTSLPIFTSSMYTSRRDGNNCSLFGRALPRLRHATPAGWQARPTSLLLCVGCCSGPLAADGMPLQCSCRQPRAHAAPGSPFVTLRRWCQTLWRSRLHEEAAWPS